MPPLIFSRYRERVEEELRIAVASLSDWTVAGSGRPAATQDEQSASSLTEMLQYHMGWADHNGDTLEVPAFQGKGLRPTLCLFACEALGGDWTRALPTAAGLELIHNFSLIHDDIQDGDLERRHRPTVWALWGQQQALVAGNAMRSLGRLHRAGAHPQGSEPGKGLRGFVYAYPGVSGDDPRPVHGPGLREPP